MHFSCAMQIDLPLIKQPQFAALVNNAIEHPIKVSANTCTQKTPVQNPLEEPIAEMVIKKRKSLPSIFVSHCKECVTINQYQYQTL